MATVLPIIIIIIQLSVLNITLCVADIYIPQSVKGELCNIPFEFKGQVYHDCTSEGQAQPWCFLDDTFQKWAFCKPQPNEFAGCELAKPNISVAEVKEILDQHNTFRAKLSAERMRKLSWNSELAQLAQIAANKCQHNHVDFNLCGKRGAIGQNLYYNYNEAEYPDVMPWTFVINQWSREQSLYDFKTLKCLKSRICGHFIQVAWDSSYLIGCGRAMCHGELLGKKQFSIQYYCSYYQAGNIANRAPYIESTKKCENCYFFDEHGKFRCDSNSLCETCDKNTEGCIGTEEVKDFIKNKNICADLDSNCAINKNICAAVKGGSKIPPLLQYVKKCQKTCGVCV